jgi:dipeptidyl aminopeptidase/acylaminoacyl peptidase
MLAATAARAATGKGLKPDLTRLKRSRSGHIAYIRDVTESGQEKLLGTDRLNKLYVMTGEGEGQDPFIYPEGLTIVTNPWWASDGKSILVTSNHRTQESGFYFDAFQIRREDGKVRRLTGSAGAVEDPDGTGTILGSVTNGTGKQPVGGKLAYKVFWKGGKGKYEDTGATTFKITGVPAGTVWVKAFHSKHIGGLDVVEVKKGESVRASINLGLGNYLATYPSITPDNRYVVALFQQAIYRYKQTVELQGDDTMVIFDRRKQGVPVATWVPTKMGEGEPTKDPRISPDGRHIVFCIGSLPIESLAVCSFRSFLRENPDTQKIVEGQRIFGFHPGGTGNINPAWSPDGRKIAFTQYTATTEGVTGNICVINLDGSGAYQLTQAASNEIAVHPTWSPNGRYIAFQLISSRGTKLDLGEVLKGNIVSDIYRIRADGSDLTQLTKDGKSGEPTWGP